MTRLITLCALIISLLALGAVIVHHERAVATCKRQSVTWCVEGATFDCRKLECVRR